MGCSSLVAFFLWFFLLSLPPARAADAAQCDPDASRLTRVSQRGFATESAAAKPQEALYALKRAMWKHYFATTTPETAQEPVRRGIVATVEKAEDTTQHAFVDDPVLGLFHRVTEMTAQDPFIKLYREYLECRDPKREKELLAKIDAVLPVEFNETTEEVLDKVRIPYLFLSDFAKAEGKH